MRAPGGLLRARQQLERGVVVDAAAAQLAAVPVVGVLAAADVRDAHETRRRLAEGAHRALDGPLVVPGRAALGVLVLRDAEEHHGGDALREGGGSRLGDEVGRLPRHTRHRRDRLLDALARTGEEREHEVRGGETRLAHQPAQRRRPAQTAQPDGGKAHFGALYHTAAR
jgi:hypothetical protein